MVPINIQNFIFNPYKIKSHFLVPVKFSHNIFSFCKKKLSTFLVFEMLNKNVTGPKKYDFIL